MKLLHEVQEASKTGDYSRLSRKAAERVLRVIAEWLDGHGHHGPADILRDESTR